MIRGSELGSGARRAESGSSLIEVLVALVLMALTGIGVLFALGGSIRVSTLHRTAADAELAGRNFAEALGDASYVPCAAPADYQAVPGFVVASRFTVTVTKVEAWTGDATQ